MGKIKSNPDIVISRQKVWLGFISEDYLSNKRLPKESYVDYKKRLNSNAKIVKILLRKNGRPSVLIPSKKVSYPYRHETTKGNTKGKHKHIVYNPKKKSFLEFIKLKITKALRRNGNTRVPAIMANRTMRIPIV